jgi:hypothetical protein
MHDVREDLLGQMIMQEKVALLAGTNGWYTVPNTTFSYSPLWVSAQQIGLDDTLQVLV